MFLSAAPRDASAYVLGEDEFEEISTEIGAIIRSFTFFLAGDILEPPLAAEDNSPLFREILDLRLYFQHRTPRYKVVIHNALVNTIRSSDALELIGLGRTGGPPLLLPLFVEIADDENVLLRNDVDWIYAAFNFGPVTATVGRQPITIGRGSLWSPLDLIGTFALTEVDRDYKPGADAVRLQFSLGARTNITAIASTGELIRDQDGDGKGDYDLEAERRGTTGILRATTGGDRWEGGLLGGYVRGDLVAGGDMVFDLGQVKLYAEGSATFPSDDSVESPASDDDVVGKALLGATIRAGDLLISPEIFYNGFGASDPDDYAAVALSSRVDIGEQVTLGELHSALFFDYSVTPVLKLRGGALVNTLDPSALATGRLIYDASGSTQLILGTYVPVGEGPEATGDPAAPFQLQSEFGAYPYFAFAEFKTIL